MRPLYDDIPHPSRGLSLQRTGCVIFVAIPYFKAIFLWNLGSEFRNLESGSSASRSQAARVAEETRTERRSQTGPVREGVKTMRVPNPVLRIVLGIVLVSAVRAAPAQDPQS